MLWNTEHQLIFYHVKFHLKWLLRSKVREGDGTAQKGWPVLQPSCLRSLRDFFSSEFHVTVHRALACVLFRAVSTVLQATSQILHP